MTRHLKDQMGRCVEVCHLPQRIVSLVPSQTELLFDLGLEKEVVGITKFCIHPNHWYRNKTRIGGTKSVNLEQVRALKPDLIIGNKEENQEQDILTLECEFPVWMSDITDLNSALSMIESIGNLTHKENVAQSLSKSIQHRFEDIKIPIQNPMSVLYLIWNNPLMAAGTDTFIHQMLHAAGFSNFIREAGRYPKVDPEQLDSKNHPDFVFLSSEPFPFKSKHVDEIQGLFSSSTIQLVDGEMFSWYGSRMLKAADYFEKLSKVLLK